MKNLIYSVVLLLFVTVVSAQGNKEAIQGEWKIVAIQTSGIYYEFSTGLIILDESLKAEGEPTAEELDMVREQMKTQTAQIANNFISFNKDQFKLGYGPDVREGKFELKEKETGSYIEATYTTGSIKKIDYILKDNVLSLILPAEEGLDLRMIYKQG